MDVILHEKLKKELFFDLSGRVRADWKKMDTVYCLV